jgi:hypothetical protein
VRARTLLAAVPTAPLALVGGPPARKRSL